MFFCLFLPPQSVTCRKREVRGINIVHSPVCEGVEELASLVAGVQPSKFKFSLSWLDLFQQIFHWIRAGHVLAASLVLVATTISPLWERDWGLNIDLGPPQPRPTCYYEALPWLGSDSSQELRQWMARREERPDLPGLLVTAQSRRWWAGEEE